MISCFIFYSPFCLMNLLQKIPLQFDEEQGLWILRRELAVSVSHHALHLCLFGSKFLSLQNCCAFNTRKKKKTALSFEFLIRYQCWNYPITHMPNFKKKKHSSYRNYSIMIFKNYAQGKHLDSHQYCVGLISWLPSFVHHTHTCMCARAHARARTHTHTHDIGPLKPIAFYH